MRHLIRMNTVCSGLSIQIIGYDTFLTAYHAPLDIFVELNKIAADPKIHTLPTDKQVNVCVGKEWYRYPSSFFLPASK